MGREFSVRRGATKVVFGAGAWRSLPRELEETGATRVLLVGTPGRAKDLAELRALLGDRCVGSFSGAREHVPAETVAEAHATLGALSADFVVAVGGGSAIGLAKALATTEAVRIACLPTTYSGSEMTAIYGITEGAKKRTAEDERARARLVLYDPERTFGLPRTVTLESLWNALAHAAEALWVDTGDRATRGAAETAAALITQSLGRLALDLDDQGAREDALEGAYLAGCALADAGTALQHKICHVLGGMFDLPHAATHAVMLPHVTRFHGDAAPLAMAALSRALDVVDPVAALFRLARATSVAPNLSALGMPRDGLPRVVEAMLALPPLRPRALTRESLAHLLEGAFDAPTVLRNPGFLRAPDEVVTQPGYGGTHVSEALPGALPPRQNAPRLCPYGLLSEMVNGTPFTVRRGDNSRVWLYRIRASFSHGEMVPLPAGAFTSPLEAITPNRTRWRPTPIPHAPREVDFLDGLASLGGAGEPTGGPGYRVSLYAANADMADRAFANADGDLLLVPQVGTLECRTELGWLRAAPGTVVIIPRGIRFAIGFAEGEGRGWMLEVFGTQLRLPERGLIGSNGLADERHFLAPTASYEDRKCPAGFQIVTKLGGRLFAATQEHSPFDVVAWHGSHVPFAYDLANFSPMGSVKFDHPDPSVLTVLTAPLDAHGRAVCDFVLFPGRWDVLEGSFRPPFMHRNAASEINGVLATRSPAHGYEPGCTFVTPLLAAHGVSTATYDAILEMGDEMAEGPVRLPDDSLWFMFESALPFHPSRWAKRSPLLDPSFLALFEGMRSRFDPRCAPRA